MYEVVSRVEYIIAAPNLPSDRVVYKHFHDSAPTEPTHSGEGLASDVITWRICGVRGTPTAPGFLSDSCVDAEQIE